MSFLHQLIDTILHIDIYLNSFVAVHGLWTYLVLFAVIFCETGLIITPILPGDSLLFAAGSIAAQAGNPLNIFILFILLFLASILGNQVNYIVGRFLGPQLFNSKRSWLLNKDHLQDTHNFYKKHGSKTLILARFIPIIRTFAPFVAGIGKMGFVKFTVVNLLSALLWIGSLLSLGYFLGSLPLIKANFAMVIYAIVIISIAPSVYAFLVNRYCCKSQDLHTK